MSDKKFILVAGVLGVIIFLVPIFILIKQHTLNEQQKKNRLNFIGALIGLCFGIIFGLLNRYESNIIIAFISKIGYTAGLLCFLNFIYTVYKQE